MVDLDRLIWIVTGVQLNAELGDRPLAYRLEREIKSRLQDLLGETPEGELPPLAPAVISDVYYLNSDPARQRPVISIGGPGVNALSAELVNLLPTVVSIEDTLVIQMDIELHDTRIAIWGMDHLETIRAVDLFLSRGYLDTFINAIVASSE